MKGAMQTKMPEDIRRYGKNTNNLTKSGVTATAVDVTILVVAYFITKNLTGAMLLGFPIAIICDIIILGQSVEIDGTTMSSYIKTMYHYMVQLPRKRLPTSLIPEKKKYAKKDIDSAKKNVQKKARTNKNYIAY